MWRENQDVERRERGAPNTHTPGPTIKSTFKNTRLEMFFLYYYYFK